SGEICDADEPFNFQRLQRLDLRLARGDNRQAVFFLPVAGDLGFALEAVDHEWRRAFGMNQIDAVRRQLADPFFVGRERLAKLVRVAALKADVGRQNADALGQQADEFFQRSRAMGRLDESYSSSPAR